ncbi:S-adenosyl-L-methionine-dependent methyltransferase [Paraphysoderma sedebokerense]|nr:S-adenosyl-L-methionine-dependent methyltransferase [Paraphysoderma sedebokerense]
MLGRFQTEQRTTGGKKYDQHSIPQKLVIDISMPEIEALAQNIPSEFISPAPTSLRTQHMYPPFTIVDYGSSSGQNSVKIVKRVIDIIRSRSGSFDQPITVIHNDLPSNDFSQLIYNIYHSAEGYHAIPPSDTVSTDPKEKEALVRQHEHQSKMIFPLISATSFYKPVVPTNVVHFGLTFNSVHWLSSLPALVPAVHRHAHSPHCPVFHFNSHEISLRAVYSEKASSDWIQFLASRSREMVQGGKLLVECVGLKQIEEIDHARESEEAREVYNRRDLFGVPAGKREWNLGFGNLVRRALQQSVSEGLVGREQYERFVIPIYYRTETELSEAITDQHSPVHKQFSIDHLEIRTYDDPLYMKFKLGHFDRQEYAREYTGWVRAWMEATFFSVFDERQTENMMKVSVHDILDNFFDTMQRLITENPDDYVFEHSAAIMCLTKL